jgi:hypothetical protein
MNSQTYNLVRTKPLLLIAIILLLLAACSIPAATQPEAQEVIVVRDNPTLPKGCSPAEVAQLIMGFLDAYNNGDQEQLIRFFPRTFEWYSDTVKADGVEVDEEHHFNFTTRPGSQDVLLDYVAERHQYGDHLRLVSVDVAGPGWHGGADIAFRLTREADDLEPDGHERYVEGGGTISCQTREFMVWGMGTRPPDYPESHLARVCPEPPAGTSENAVIACARPVPEEGE